MTKQNEKDAKRVPELRFKGFTDDWEQRKLGDITRRYDNLRVPVTASKRKHGDIPYYGANGIQDFVSGYTHDGEFILVAEDGAKDPKDYPVNYVNGKIWVNNHAHVLQGIQGLANNLFLLNGIKKINIVAYLVGGSRAKLNAETLMQLSIKLPSIHEQEKIGQLFQSLDKTITLHEEKHRQLEQLKKALLQKMFADETGYPILRFKGFSDAWEQRRLKNVAKSNIGGGTPKTSVKEYWGGTLPWIQSSDLIEGELFDVHVKKHITEIGIKNSAAKLIPKNSIAVVTRVGVGKLAFLPFEYATSQDFLSLNGVTGNPRFITYALQLAIKKLVRQLQGTSIKGITKSELLKILIKVPLEMAEQEKVSNLLLSTDSLITFHQHKIDNLKRLKRALLQKMFV
ncbi:restriction endonuclease subunit S [Limosilactobacillus mucosae]|uniref:Restriction endonuclease subunit S n=1 Tax=Limosilactobacillus mucosae TaxID=97478 RepID=A0AAJ1HTR1_LIMMU|nr:restriction endonuclease subunit S [Limosilactobacillus mucosae]MDC2829176.1 restriction endonuclease subunit S [Limosilactobacillus mucosae]